MNAAEAVMAGIFGSKGSGGDVSGVKGDAEETYRTGNVNITAANVGAYTKTETDTLLNSKADTTDVDNVKIASTATGTSITLTDSADGFVQGITIKGHSEVVDGTIKSIGDAGWGVVDLGTLTWTYASSDSVFYAGVDDGEPSINTQEGTGKGLCSVYNIVQKTYANMVDYDMLVGSRIGGTNKMYICAKNTAYTDVTAFKSAMSGVLLYYPLADTTGATPTFGITSKNGEGQGTAATITTGLPLRSVSDSIYDTLDNDKVVKKCAGGKVNDTNIWSWSKSTTLSNENRTVFYVTKTDCSYPANQTTLPTFIMSGGFETQTQDETWTPNHISCEANEHYICVVVSPTITTVEAFLTAYGNEEIYYPLATPTETPLTSAEKSALASLRTYDHTTHIDATDAPTMTVDYLLNTNNGQAVARVDKKTSQGVIYSLDEVKTDDVWIDGKPIYRRTIQFTRWNEQFDATSMNIDNFFVDYSHSFFAAHSSTVSYTAPFVNDGVVRFDVWYDINNKMINMRTNGLSGNNTLDAAYYTILYTKTTDTGNG